jgi:uncharacterized protein (DUF1697 family)
LSLVAGEDSPCSGTENSTTVANAGPDLAAFTARLKPSFSNRSLLFESSTEASHTRPILQGTMPAVIAMLRAVNLGSHNRIRMDALCALCSSLKFSAPQTYVQSGNVVFRTSERDLSRVAKAMEKRIERDIGFRTDVIVRSEAEMRDVIARNPFAKRRDVESNKLLVLFFGNEPGGDAPEKIRSIKANREELHLDGRELYVYFPDGMGRSKVSTSAIERMLKVPGTGRNWNSVTKLLEMAEGMGKAGSRH